MTTLKFHKAVDDIEQPKLLPEDWYIVQVVNPPTIEDNDKAKKKLSYEEGAGKNLIIQTRTVSNIAEYNGRAFKIYLPCPVEQDLNAFDGRGMNKYDAKMERIAEFAEKATGCSIYGNEVTILPNARIGVYITQALDQQGKELVNNLNWFSGFKTPDEVDSEEKKEFSQRSDEDKAF